MASRCLTRSLMMGRCRSLCSTSRCDEGRQTCQISESARRLDFQHDGVECGGVGSGSSSVSEAVQLAPKLVPYSAVVPHQTPDIAGLCRRSQSWRRKHRAILKAHSILGAESRRFESGRPDQEVLVVPWSGTTNPGGGHAYPWASGSFTTGLLPA